MLPMYSCCLPSFTTPQLNGGRRPALIVDSMLKSLSPQRVMVSRIDVNHEEGALLEDDGANQDGVPTANYTSLQDRSTPDLDEGGSSTSRAVCRPTIIVHPTLTLVQLIFSGYHVLTAWALNSKGVDSFVFALYREISASIFIAIIMFYAVGKRGGSMLVARKDWWRFLLMGLFSAMNVLGAIYCLSLISPTNLAVMQPSIPVFTMIFSVVCRMERLTLLKAVGLSCAVAGAVCVEVIRPQKGGGHDGVSSSDFVLGNIVVVMQCVGMAALLVTQKTVLDRYHPTVVVTWYYTLGSLITLVVCVAKQTPLANYALSSEIKPWLALGYAALFGTAFNYNVYSWAGSVVAPGIVAIYSTIQPISTGLFSFIVFGTEPSWGEVLCGILVVVGLVLTVTARNIEDRLRKKPVFDLKQNGNGSTGQAHASPSRFQPVGPDGGDRA